MARSSSRRGAGQAQPFRPTAAGWALLSFTAAVWCFIAYLLVFHSPLLSSAADPMAAPSTKAAAASSERLARSLAPLLAAEVGWKPAEREKRTIVIGDVHGCADELQELLDACQYREGIDRLLLVGDLVGKGPKSLEVLRMAREVGAVCVRGNHDNVLVQYYDAMLGPEATGVMPKHIKKEYQKLAATLSPEDWQFLLSWPFYAEIDVSDSMESGLQPGVPVEKQVAEVLMTVRNVLPETGKVTDAQGEGVAWLSTLGGLPVGQTLVFGHDAVRGLQVKEEEEAGGRRLLGLGLDTGSCYGNQLSAFVLPDQQIVQVQAHAIYEKPKLKLNPAS